MLETSDSYDKVATCTKFIKNLDSTISAAEAKILEILGYQNGGKGVAPVGRVVESEDFLGFRLQQFWKTDSDSSSFKKPTPTPAVLKNQLRLQQF